MPSTPAPHSIPYSAGTDQILTIDAASQGAAERVGDLLDAVLGPWRTVAEATSTYSDAVSAGVPYVFRHGAALVAEGTDTGSTPPALIYFDPADYAIAGYDLKVRLRAVATSNGTAPGSTGFDIGLRILTASGGGPDAQTLDVGAIAVIVLGLEPGVNDAVSDFSVVDAPTAGVYVFTSFSDPVAADSAGTLYARLEINHVA